MIQKYTYRSLVIIESFCTVVVVIIQGVVINATIHQITVRQIQTHQHQRHLHANDFTDAHTLVLDTCN